MVNVSVGNRDGQLPRGRLPQRDILHIPFFRGSKVQADVQGGKAEGAEDNQHCKARAAQEFFHKLLLSVHCRICLRSKGFFCTGAKAERLSAQARYINFR